MLGFEGCWIEEITHWYVIEPFAGMTRVLGESKLLLHIAEVPFE